MVPQISKNASQMRSKAPNFDLKSVKMDQEWVQNGQDGPKWPIRGLKYDFGSPFIQKENLTAWMAHPFWVPKWSKNRSKTIQKKQLFLEAGSDAIFLFFTHFHLKMVLKWNQVGIKIDTKTISHQKSGFSF